MDALLFMLFVVVGISLLAYFMKKSSSAAKTRLHRKEKQIQKAGLPRADVLATPGITRLSDKDEIWRTRRNHLSRASKSADHTLGTRYFKYQADEEPSYDGYSRSERHHITPARIRRERHLDDIVLPGHELKKQQKPSQAQETS